VVEEPLDAITQCVNGLVDGALYFPARCARNEGFTSAVLNFLAHGIEKPLASRCSPGVSFSETRATTTIVASRAKGRTVIIAAPVVQSPLPESNVVKQPRSDAISR
jgi:hypothetical protein